MNDKTKLDKISVKYLVTYLFSLFYISILILIIVGSVRGDEGYSFFEQPWMIASFVTVESGIAEFSGDPYAISIVSRDYMYSLLGVLAFYVLAPTLFFIGWKNIC